MSCPMRPRHARPALPLTRFLACIAISTGNSRLRVAGALCFPLPRSIPFDTETHICDFTLHLSGSWTPIASSPHAPLALSWRHLTLMVAPSLCRCDSRQQGCYFRLRYLHSCLDLYFISGTPRSTCSTGRVVASQVCQTLAQTSSTGFLASKWHNKRKGEAVV